MCIRDRKPEHVASKNLIRRMIEPATAEVSPDEARRLFRRLPRAEVIFNRWRADEKIMKNEANWPKDFAPFATHYYRWRLHATFVYENERRRQKRKLRHQVCIAEALLAEVEDAWQFIENVENDELWYCPG